MKVFYWVKLYYEIRLTRDLMMFLCLEICKPNLIKNANSLGYGRKIDCLVIDLNLII